MTVKDRPSLQIIIQGVEKEEKKKLVSTTSLLNLGGLFVGEVNDSLRVEVRGGG